jgi:hypothetical protein
VLRALAHPARLRAGLRAHFDVRLGSHRLPHLRWRSNTRVFPGTPVRRLVERVDSRS